MMDRWQALYAAGEAPAGAAAGEARRARDGAIVCGLADYALLSFEGEDAESFLHGQLSSDIVTLAKDRWQLATYNSPKGRVLAALMLWRSERGFLAQLPASIGEATARRLSMYVLRSKVRIHAIGDRMARIGVGGPDAERVLTAAGVELPAHALGVAREQRLQSVTGAVLIDYVLRLSGNRFELVTSEEESAIALWQLLERHGATPAAFSAWRWLTLHAGVAEIGPETQDQFVAQMLNYELIGAISFNKGCYPGQEIVARTQYRGSIKRRTVLARTATAIEPTPGTPVVNDGADSPIGMVVNVAAAPDGGYDLLVCIHVELAVGILHLGDMNGPQIELLEMPYSIAVPA